MSKSDELEEVVFSEQDHMLGDDPQTDDQDSADE
jgi:hypothetical protein